MATRAQVAAKLGITRQRVGQLIKDGRIEERNGSIDLDKAVADYNAFLDPMKRLAYVARTKGAAQPPSGSDGQGVMDFTAARTEKERANAMRAQLEYKIKAGHFVSRDEVAAKEFAIARKIRDRIIGFPAKLANLVPPDAMKTITDECEALVRELQDEIAAIAEETAA